RIVQLEGSLDSLTIAFTERAAQTYKLARLNNPYLMLFTTDDLDDVVNSFHYLSRIQAQDQDLLTRLQSAQNTYKKEKTDQEDLQEELKDQQEVLGSQKRAKSQLLNVTRNDEKRYQHLLSQARAERDAIQSIIAGKGDETEVGGVGEGERIASVISSSSACSSGAHLHFEVVVDQSHRNPSDYLIPKEVVWDNAPDGPFGFGGSWQWPINDPVRITQGYGSTYYASVLRYYRGAIHTGIDMVNTSDYTVKSVKAGTLYRGAIACGGGTLRYVRVKHDGGLDTYYLHVNY
ncbi:coiled-coil domain-containing protein, partial [Patescibacteria group bacterium]